MNCDTAFELMTEPYGGRSLALHEHLAQCPRCRQMQETLAPALEWLLEAAQSPAEDLRCESTGDSPASQSSRMPNFAMEGAVTIAQQAADALSIRCAPSKVRFRRWITATVRSTALLAIGGFLALTLFPGGHTADPSAQGRAPGNDTPCRRHDVAAARAESRSPAEIRALIASCAACHDHLREADRADRRQRVIDPNSRRVVAMTFVTFGLL